MGSISRCIFYTKRLLCNNCNSIFSSLEQHSRDDLGLAERVAALPPELDLGAARVVAALRRGLAHVRGAPEDGRGVEHLWEKGGKKSVSSSM